MIKDQGLECIKKQAQQIINLSAPYTQEEADEIRRVMLSFCMNKYDYALAEALCEKFIKSSDDNLKMIAITCVGHVARVYHRKLNSKIMEEIDKIHKDPTHKNWGTADDVLDDINLFVK